MRVHLVIAFVLCTASTAAAQAVSDSKLWLSGTGEADLTHMLRAGASLELRNGADSGYDQTRVGLELGIKLNKYFGFDVFYVLMLRDGDPRLGTVDETRHRIGVDANQRFDTDRLTIGNRIRLHNTTYELDSDHVHLRDKVHVGYEVVEHVTPYVALELIYLLSPKSEYRETRFYVGVDWHAMKRLDLGAFFLRQVETNVQMPEHNNIIGLEATYLFRRVKKHKIEPADHD